MDKTHDRTTWEVDQWFLTISSPSLPSGALVVRQGIFGQEKEFLNRRVVDAG